MVTVQNECLILKLLKSHNWLAIWKPDIWTINRLFKSGIQIVAVLGSYFFTQVEIQLSQNISYFNWIFSNEKLTRLAAWKFCPEYSTRRFNIIRIPNVLINLVAQMICYLGLTLAGGGGTLSVGADGKKVAFSDFDILRPFSLKFVNNK